MVQAPRRHPLNRMKVAPVRVFDQRKQMYIDTYAGLDSAAGHCICSSELMNLLNLKGIARRTAVVPVTGTTEVSTLQHLTIDIRGYRTSEIFQIDAIALDRMTDLSEHIPSQADIDRNPHLRGLKIPEHKRKKVDILICIGESVLQHTYDTRVARDGQLWATCTGLGWVVHGRDYGMNSQNMVHGSSFGESTHETPSPKVQVNAVRAECGTRERPPPDGECEILDKVRQTFAIDYSEPQHGREKSMSRTAHKMLQRQRNSFQIKNGRCEVGKLWRASPHELLNNRKMAEQSLYRLRRRLLANPTLLAQYKEFFDKMEANNQMTTPQDELGSQPGYFLLHHPVLTKF